MPTITNTSAIMESNPAHKFANSPWFRKSIKRSSSRYNFHSFPDAVLLLPRAFRVAVEEETGVPSINILKYAEKNERGTEYRVHVTVQLLPYFCSGLKKGQPLHAHDDSEQNFCIEGLHAGRCRAASFQVNQALREMNVKLYGPLAELPYVINQEECLPLTFDCSLESFFKFRTAILRGLEVGQILFELEENRGGQKITSFQSVPLEINLKNKRVYPWF